MAANPTSTQDEGKGKAVQVTVSRPLLAKMIDHSLLHPTLTSAAVEDGLKLALRYHTATACVRPCDVPLAVRMLAGTDVGVCVVVGFPHGNSTVGVKVFEAGEVFREIGEGGKVAVEIDVVVNIGRVLSHDWEYVNHEIDLVNKTVLSHGGILKVIFENDFLKPPEITELCHICTSLGVAFIKTSTGYGFVKRDDGNYSYKGATHEHLRLMRREAEPDVQIKAAGGVRTLDDMLAVMALGVTRVGATATEAIMEEVGRRGIGDEEAVVQVEVDLGGDVGANGAGAGAY